MPTEGDQDSLRLSSLWDPLVVFGSVTFLLAALVVVNVVVLNMNSIQIAMN